MTTSGKTLYKRNAAQCVCPNDGQVEDALDEEQLPKFWL